MHEVWIYEQDADPDRVEAVSLLYALERAIEDVILDKDAALLRELRDRLARMDWKQVRWLYGSDDETGYDLDWLREHIGTEGGTDNG